MIAPHEETSCYPACQVKYQPICIFKSVNQSHNPLVISQVIHIPDHAVIRHYLISIFKFLNQGIQSIMNWRIRMKRVHMGPGAESTRFCAAMKKTLVKGQNGALRLMHRAGNHNFKNRFGFFSGREEVARDATERNLPDMFSAFLDIRFPLIINQRPETLSEANTLIHQALGIAPMSVHDGFKTVLRGLEAQGHDGIAFGTWDIPDQILWLPIWENSIYPQLSGPAHDNRAPWQISVEDWAGLAIISDIFEIDGRDEEYEHLFDALDHDGKDLPVLARDEANWTVRWLNTWEPEATMGLFDSTGQACGFYTSGELWIDEPARGAGRSVMMILAAADLMGASPVQNEKGLGYSPAGYAAHMAACRMATEQGFARGFAIDPKKIELAHDQPQAIRNLMSKPEDCSPLPVNPAYEPDF